LGLRFSERANDGSLSTGQTPQNISNLEGSLLGALKLIMLIGVLSNTECCDVYISPFIESSLNNKQAMESHAIFVVNIL
jgi:hypothetical protein